MDILPQRPREGRGLTKPVLGMATYLNRTEMQDREGSAGDKSTREGHCRYHTPD